MSRKTYGQVWATNPCLKDHAPKPGNWIAKMRLSLLQSHLKHNAQLPSAQEHEEMIILGKLTFPQMKVCDLHRCARELSFEL